MRRSIKLLLLLPLIALCYAPTASAQQPTYEVGAAYDRVFLTDGDVLGSAFQITASRSLLTEWTGLALRLDYQRSVQDDLHLLAATHGASGWHRNNNYSLYINMYADVLRFSITSIENRFRIAVGPTLQRRGGEKAIWFFYPAALEQTNAEEIIQDAEQAEQFHVYQADFYGDDVGQDGRYTLISKDRNATKLGGALRISYGVTYRGVTLILGAGARMYTDKYKGYTYGLGLGYQF